MAGCRKVSRNFGNRKLPVAENFRVRQLRQLSVAGNPGCRTALVEKWQLLSFCTFLKADNRKNALQIFRFTYVFFNQCSNIVERIRDSFLKKWQNLETISTLALLRL